MGTGLVWSSSLRRCASVTSEPFRPRPHATAALSQLHSNGPSSPVARCLPLARRRQCTECGERFTSLIALNRHLERKHADLIEEYKLIDEYE